METLQSKRSNIINRMKEISEMEILTQIEHILNNKESEMYITSDAQKESIYAGLDDLKNGRTISEKEAEKEIDELNLSTFNS